MAANTWKAIGASRIADVDPANDPATNPNHPGNAPWRAVSGQAGVLGAWGSAVWDEAGRALWIPIGGGHQNYAGNECYRQPLGNDSPVWTMPRKPTGAIGNTVSIADSYAGFPNTYPDDRPRSAHVYNNVCYAPGVGPVIVRNAAVYESGQADSSWVWCLDPASGETRKVADLASAAQMGHGGADGAYVGLGINAACCHDSTRNRVVTVGTGNTRVMWLTPSANPGLWACGTLPTDIFIANGTPQALVYIPTIDRYLHLTAYSGVLKHILIHPTTGAVTNLESFTGSFASGIDFTAMTGAAWSPELGKLLLWRQNSNFTQISTATPSANPLTTAWIAGALTVNESNTVTPPAQEGNGMFGRFIYSQSLRGCILLQNNTQPSYFYATEVL